MPLLLADAMAKALACCCCTLRSRSAHTLQKEAARRAQVAQQRRNAMPGCRGAQQNMPLKERKMVCKDQTHGI